MIFTENQWIWNLVWRREWFEWEKTLVVKNWWKR